MLRRYLEALDRREKIEFIQLSNEWTRLSGTLSAIIAELSGRTDLSPDQLFRLELYRRFRQELESTAMQYSVSSSQIISAGQLEFGTKGMEAAQEMLDLSAKFYTKLPMEAITRMVGITQDGTPLQEVLLARFGENSDRAVATLRDSIAMGRNPLETARLMGADLEGNVYNSIRIARTEQLYVMREVETDAFIASGICTGKDWVAEPDACEEICIPGADASPYELDAEMDTHPNCRCSWAPVI